MQKVKEWLQGKRNFIVGRAIYRAIISNNNELIQLLDKGHTPYSQQQLINAMQEFVEPTPQKIFRSAAKTAQQRTTTITTNITPSTEIVVDKMVLQSIQLEWQMPYKKMQNLIAQLDKYGDSNSAEAMFARKNLSKEILELEQIVNSIWAKKDEYEKTGILINSGAEELVVPTDPLELAELINRTKKGVRTNRLSMLKYPEKPIYAEKYQHYKTVYLKITGKPYQDKI